MNWVIMDCLHLVQNVRRRHTSSYDGINKEFINKSSNMPETVAEFHHSECENHLQMLIKKKKESFPSMQLDELLLNVELDLTLSYLLEVTPLLLAKQIIYIVLTKYETCDKMGDFASFTGPEIDLIRRFERAHGEDDSMAEIFNLDPLPSNSSEDARLLTLLEDVYKLTSDTAQMQNGPHMNLVPMNFDSEALLCEFLQSLKSEEETHPNQFLNFSVISLRSIRSIFLGETPTEGHLTLQEHPAVDDLSTTDQVSLRMENGNGVSNRKRSHSGGSENQHLTHEEPVETEAASEKKVPSLQSDVDNFSWKTPMASASRQKRRKLTDEMDPETFAQSIFKKKMSYALQMCMDYKCSSYFRKPVIATKPTEKQSENYTDIVFRPMCLETLQRHVEQGVVRNVTSMLVEYSRIFANACMFNPSNSTYHRSAREMFNATIEHFSLFASECDIPLPPPVTMLPRSTPRHLAKMVQESDEEFYLPTRITKQRISDLDFL